MSGSISAGLTHDRLFDDAATVLRANDRGAITVAAPDLYPHQWSWDAAFVAIGLAQLSIPRAITELRSLLHGQWRNGMIPHIIFSQQPGYFPGPDRWRTDVAQAAPPGVSTSGICQPPVHGLAVHRIVTIGRSNGGTDRQAVEDFLRETFSSWLGWHRWLSSARDPRATGLVEIHHSWESGMDNSPRWDRPYAAVEPGLMAPFERRDLAHVDSADERPTDRDYERYLWLVEQLVSVGYDDDKARSVIDFRVGDVFVSALLAHSSELLAELGEGLGRTDDAAELLAIADRCRTGVRATVSPGTGLARDRDLRASEWIDTQTLAGFAPLLCMPAGELRQAQRSTLLGSQWCGHPDLRFAVPPSTAPDSPEFRPRTYWRGPQWPVVTWLLGATARRYGDEETYGQFRDQSLAQLADGTFSEYYHPLSGGGLGSRNQSWTAAVALDWMADR